MYILKTEATFDSAHFLSGYDGKCRNLHGHTWRIEAEICAETLRSEGQCRGMITDFKNIKSALKEIADELDHTLIFESGTLRPETVSALNAENFDMTEVDFRPTAENFATYIFRRLTDSGFTVKRVSVFETPENCAVYEE